MKNKKKVGRVYMALGALFAGLGAIMVVIAATAWHSNETLSWQVVVYAIINLLASYGFFTKSRWLLPGFAATIGGLAFLLVMFTANYGASAVSPASLAKIVVVAGILWFIYLTRRHLRTAHNDMYVGSFFILLLLGTVSYSVLTVLS